MSSFDTQLIVIGGGIAGLNLVHALASKVNGITLVDSKSICPDIFRAEKIEPEQVELMRQLGTLDLRSPNSDIVGVIQNFDGMHIKLVDTIEQFGISYSETVNKLKNNLPVSVNVITKKVIDIINCKGHKTIIFSDNTKMSAKLVVLCTGGSNQLIKKLGITRKYYSNIKSLSIGFDIVKENGEAFNFNGFNYCPSGGNNDIHYLTIFPIGDRIRVNIFTQLDSKNKLIKSFKNDVIYQMGECFPGLYEQIGKVKASSQVQVMPTQLYRLRNPIQSGLVIIGDEYQSVHPATGKGLSKVLTDVNVLSNKFILDWLKLQFVTKKQIRLFYKDAEKLYCDSKAMEDWIHFYESDTSIKLSLFTKIKHKLMIAGFL